MVEESEHVRTQAAIAQYNDRLGQSIFRKTKSLQRIGDFCVQGKFEEALDFIESLFDKSNIHVVYDDEVYARRRKSELGQTTWFQNKGAYYPERFKSASTVSQLFNHVHKYKSLLLRKDDIRTDDNIDQVLETDLALLDVCETGGAPKKQVDGFREKVNKRLGRVKE